MDVINKRNRKIDRKSKAVFSYRYIRIYFSFAGLHYNQVMRLKQADFDLDEGILYSGELGKSSRRWLEVDRNWPERVGGIFCRCSAWVFDPIF